MCGIAGVVGKPQDKKVVPDMLEMMHHRGPDSRGYYYSEDIQLGHCRLSINDLSDRANQPFVSNEYEIAVAVNGEIYNFQKFRSSLQKKGYKFNSDSDCEIILHAYIENNLGFVSELNGMFAIAIWDGRKKELYLIRDRLGIKPLYYTQTKNTFLFASEIKSLAVCDDVNLSTDMQSLAEYFAFENYFSNRTMNEQIKLVEPAEIVKLSLQNKTLERKYFWKPEFNESINDDVYSKYIETIRSSVNRHLISDVPVGCYLSSGIDSSSVAYWSTKKVGTGLHTYTGFFGLSGFYDEANEAARIARGFGCENRSVEIVPEDFKNNIEKIIWHLDEPRVGMGAFSQFMVAMEAAKDVKVILTGHGGDELFAGYPVFKSIFSRQNIPMLFLRSSLRELIFYTYFSIYPIIRKEAGYFLPNIFPEKSFKNLLKPDFHDEFISKTDIFKEPRLLKSRCDNNEYRRLTLTYLKYYLPALFIVEDKISMAFSLESRTPLCDNEMLDLALSTPLSKKLFKYELKHIPRTAMREKLPDFIYKLPKKGFPTPLGRWFKKELKDYVRDFIFDNIGKLDMFNEKEVKNLVIRHQKSKLSYPFDEISAHKIWIILNLIIYFKNQNARYGNVARGMT